MDNLFFLETIVEEDQVPAEPDVPDSPRSQETYATPSSQLPPDGLYERTQGLIPAGDVLSSCSSVVFVEETTRTPASLVSPTKNG